MARYCKVGFVDTLMRWDDDLGAHVQSGDRQSIFYFRIVDNWAAMPDADLQTRIYTVAQRMYADLNDGFRKAEPSDISYMYCKGTYGLLLDEANAAEKPWTTAPNPAVWEPTCCVVANEDGTYEKVARDGF